MGQANKSNKNLRMRYAIYIYSLIILTALAFLIYDIGQSIEKRTEALEAQINLYKECAWYLTLPMESDYYKKLSLDCLKKL
jgi:hypothetical protein